MERKAEGNVPTDEIRTTDNTSFEHEYEYLQGRLPEVYRRHLVPLSDRVQINPPPVGPHRRSPSRRSPSELKSSRHKRNPRDDYPMWTQISTHPMWQTAQRMLEMARSKNKLKDNALPHATSDQECLKWLTRPMKTNDKNNPNLRTLTRPADMILPFLQTILNVRNDDGSRGSVSSDQDKTTQTTGVDKETASHSPMNVSEDE